MFFIVMLFLVMLMFSGGGYYGPSAGLLPRTAYGGIGLDWIVILFGLLFLMPHWGMMRP
jgi:hypothetical protein